MPAEVTFDEAMTRLKKLVYKNRIRLNEFLTSFDRLRAGTVYPGQFKSGLSTAGIDKFLSPAEIQTICDYYTVQLTPSLEMVEYRRFIQEVDAIFATPNLEKNPLISPIDEPSELLDRDRYQRSNKFLGDDKEGKLGRVLQRLSESCSKRGMMLKPFFDDAAADDNSTKLYGHVTVSQFKQCMNVKAGLILSDEESKLLVDKYVHEDYPELVNYVALSNTIDPPIRDNEGTIQSVH